MKEVASLRYGVIFKKAFSVPAKQILRHIDKEIKNICSYIDNCLLFHYTVPMKIHDSGYGTLFRNRTIFRQLIETVVKEPWVEELDFAQAETIETTFIDEDYKQTESDLIYRLKLRDKEVYFYILMEFQSTVDYWMVLRIAYLRKAFIKGQLGQFPFGLLVFSSRLQFRWQRDHHGQSSHAFIRTAPNINGKLGRFAGQEELLVGR